jgi:tripartite-type tricarboxylate transporter receptor subunit TctC
VQEGRAGLKLQVLRGQVRGAAVVAPAGTPANIVARLNQEVNKALALPEVRTHLDAEGAEPTPTTPQAFGALIAREIPRWDRVAKAAHIHLD